VARCTGYCWLAYPANIAFDPAALYRYRVRVRQVSDPTDGTSKAMYAGLSGYAQDGTSLYTCKVAGGAYYITLAGHKLTAGSGWAEYTGYLRGTGRATGSAWDEDRPARAYPGCTYIRPLIAVNHPYGDGVADIDYITLEVEARTGQVFEGYVDDLRETHRPEGVAVEVTCRDRSKRLQLDRWTEDKTYEDTGAGEGSQLIVSVSASSELGAGSEIQSQSRLGTRTLKATVAGIAREVAPDTESGSIEDGDYSVVYSAPGLSQLELTQVLDLCAGEDLQAVVGAAAGNVQPDPHFDQGMTGKSFYNWGGLGTVTVSDGVCLLDNAAEPTQLLALITSPQMQANSGPYTLTIRCRSAANGEVAVQNYLGNGYHPVGTAPAGGQWVILTHTYAEGEYTTNPSQHLQIPAGCALEVDWIQLEPRAISTAGNVWVEMSSDGQAWAEFIPGMARYLKVVITRATGPITAGIVITTNSSYPANNALLDDESCWRPSPDDLAPSLELDCGSVVTMRHVLARLGLSDSDPLARYRVEVQYWSDYYGKWFSPGMHLSTGLALESVLAEPLGDLPGVQRLRLRFLGRYSAPVAVRYVAVKKPVTPTTNSALYKLIRDVAAGAGETRLDITQTYSIAPALTWERGRDKWECLAELMADHGWDVYYDRHGYLVARPADVDPWREDLPSYRALLSAEASWTDADIWNTVLAENGDPEAPLTATAVNDSAWSATSTVHLGPRVGPVVQAPLANTQAKLDAFALRELERASRQTAQVRLETLADGKDPAAELEPGDVIEAVREAGGEGRLYVVESVTLAATPTEYTVQAEVSEL